MKRIGHLYEKIITIENLELADKKARKGKNKQSYQLGSNAQFLMNMPGK